MNESTVKWLREKAPQLQEWEGTELKACVGDEIPKAHVITVFFPRSKDLTNEDLLDLVTSHNEDMRLVCGKH